jgi:hypothetical protein
VIVSIKVFFLLGNTVNQTKQPCQAGRKNVGLATV